MRPTTILLGLLFPVLSAQAAEHLGGFQQFVSGTTSGLSAIATLPLSDGSTTIVYQVPNDGTNCPDAACIGIVHFDAQQRRKWIRIKSARLTKVVAATIDSANRIAVTGRTVTGGLGGEDFAVLRFKTNGSDDLSFAATGQVVVAFNLGQKNNDIPTAITVDGLDNVIVVGTVQRNAANDEDFGVVRLSATNGLPDASFGTNGKRVIAFDLGPEFRFDAPYAVAVGSDGKIVIAGIANDNLIAWDQQVTLGHRPVLARLNPNGGLDASFCNPSCNHNQYPTIHSGRRVSYFGSSQAHADFYSAVDVADNGNIVVAGTYYEDGPLKTRAGIAVFAPNGNQLQERIEVGTDDYARYMTVRYADGAGTRIIAAGQSVAHPNGLSNGYFVVQAYTGGLVFDSSYGACLTAQSALCFAGTGGPNHGNVAVKSLEIDPLGRPLISGNLVPESNPAFSVALFQGITNDFGPLP